MTKRLWWIFGLLMIAALVATGCKSGDDDDDDIGNPQTCFSVDAVEFVADGPSGTVSVWLDGVQFESGSKTFTLNVMARGFTGESAVYGIAGRLLFEGGREGLILAGATPGSALGAADAQLAAAASGEGHDIFGFSKKGDPASGAEIAGEALLGILQFSLEGIDASIEGVTSFDADASRALDNGLDPLTVDGWGGGKLTITVTEHQGEASC